MWTIQKSCLGWSATQITLNLRALVGSDDTFAASNSFVLHTPFGVECTMMTIRSSVSVHLAKKLPCEHDVAGASRLIYWQSAPTFLQVRWYNRGFAVAETFLRKCPEFARRFVRRRRAFRCATCATRASCAPLFVAIFSRPPWSLQTWPLPKPKLKANPLPS